MKVAGLGRVGLTLWFSLLAAALGLMIAVLVAPERFLFFIAPDRRVQFLPASILLLFQGFATVGVVCLLTVTWLAWVRWPTVQPKVWLWCGQSADEFVSRVATDVRTWVKTAEGKAHAVVIAVLVSMGFIFRWAPLHFPAGYDESISLVWFSSRSLLDVVSDYRIPNNHVLYNSIVNVLIRLFGISTTTIRLPAFAAGLLLIPWSYWLTRRLFAERAALLAAGLAAAAPMVMEYSTQGRGYSLSWLLLLSTFM